MSGKNEKAARRLAAVVSAPLPAANAARFHPQRDLLLCRSRIEGVSKGGIVLPQNRAIAIPIGEILDVGPDVEGYEKGELILFAMTAALAIDTQLFIIEAGKVLAKVDPASALVTT